MTTALITGLPEFIDDATDVGTPRILEALRMSGLNGRERPGETFVTRTIRGDGW